MKWFDFGLDKSEIKKRYRELVKQYHPDMHPGEDHYNSIIQEINAEYDEYVELGINRHITNSEVPISIGNYKYLFVRRNKYAYNSFFAIDRNTSNYRYGECECTSTNDGSWNNFEPGIAYCEEINPKYSFIFHKEIRLVDTKFDDPKFSDIIKWFFSMNNDPDFRDLKFTKIMLIKTNRYGEMVIIEYPIGDSIDILVLRDNKVHDITVTRKDLGKYIVLENYAIADLILIDKFGYSVDEFMKSYDASWCIKPQYMKPTTGENTIAFFGDYHDTLKMEPFDNDMINDAITSYFARKGIVKIYRSKLRPNVKYGFFDINKIIENLKYIDGIDDINEVQEYLDRINDYAESEIRRMIKKGTIKIKI